MFSIVKGFVKMNGFSKDFCLGNDDKRIPATTEGFREELPSNIEGFSREVPSKMTGFSKEVFSKLKDLVRKSIRKWHRFRTDFCED